mgnify:CR=1 FL=1
MCRIYRVQVMGCKSVRASRLGDALAKREDLSKPERCLRDLLRRHSPPHTFSFVLTYFRGTSELDDGPGTEALQTVPHFFLKISRSGLTRAMPRVKLSGKSVQQLCCACQ